MENKCLNVEAKQLYESLGNAYWEWNLESGSVYYSANFMALLGYKARVHIDHYSFWQQYLNPEVLTYLIAQFKQNLSRHSNKLDVNIPITDKQGRRKWINLIGTSTGCKGGICNQMVGFIRDITKTKLLIENLKESNDYLELAEQISLSGHWRIDMINNQIEWSDEVYRIYGVSKNEFPLNFERITQFVIKTEQEKMISHFNNAIENSIPFHLKCTIEQASGKRVKIECKCEVETDQQGKVTSVFGIIRDVTKEERNLERLKLSALVNHTINVPIFFINESNDIVHQDLFSQNTSTCTSLFDYVDFSMTEFTDLKNKAKQLGQITYKQISFDKFNSVFDISVTYEKGSQIYIWIVENITIRYHQKQQQVISDRLALLGNTFGSVSHDINNVLGVALGSIELLEIKANQGERDLSKYINRVKNAIDKGKDVTERLLAFTREPRSNVIQFDPIKEIKDNLYLFEQVVLDTVDFSFYQDNAQCVINFPHGEFTNILLNLMINANDAIREQGSTGKICLTAHINSDECLEIHIKDSGVGIEKDKISKIFDPFYSSKSISKGNGIGLANVYNTMYKHKGKILVDGKGELGGADFTLLFQCKIVNKPPPKDDNETMSLNIEGKKILILDDEISIAEFIALYLNNAGAESTFVSTKSEFEEILKQKKQFDIFITDMIMPDLTGEEAVALVLEIYPNIKIYSISGYLSLEDRDWAYPVLRKPFNSKELKKFIYNN